MEFRRLGVRRREFWSSGFPDLGLVNRHAHIVPDSQTSCSTYNRGVPETHPRILGLDVGSKTIGIAVSDPLGITAQGLETIRRQNKRVDFERLGQVIRQYEVSEIVVGYPLRLSGMEGSQAEKMQLFASELRERFRLPVHLWDERLTSAEANRVLRDSEMSIKRRGEVVDRLAAVLILQSWMDRRTVG
jgi:putative pre-16S rRNA nuclease